MEKDGPKGLFRIYGDKDALMAGLNLAKSNDEVYNGVSSPGTSKYLCDHILVPFIEMVKGMPSDTNMEKVKDFMLEHKELFAEYVEHESQEIA
jgi:hypothetical protein